MRTWVCGVLLIGLGVGPAMAQTDGTRPALPTIAGDTGLWFVPTAEVLPDGRWSGSIYRANVDRRQGLTDVSQIGLTLARGFGDHVELFGGWRVVRLARGTQPFFVAGDPAFGGVQHDYPYLRNAWSGTLGGPITIGGKWSFIAQGRGDAMSLASRLTIDLPTGPAEAGTDSVTGRLDLVASREFGERIELTGTVGVRLRRDTDEFRLPNGLAWGLGASVPSRSRLRALVEFDGEFLTRENVQLRTAYTAADGSTAPVLSPTSDPKDVKFGLVWQSLGGWFVHGGANYSVGTRDRTIGQVPVGSSAWGFDLRFGWHGGNTIYVPPPPPEPEIREVIREVPAPAPPAPAPNRSPQVTGVQCKPCVVQPGGSAQLVVQGTDPDGDPLTYRWTAQQGTLKPAEGAQVTWTAPTQPGDALVTVTADDGRGGITSGSVTLRVVAPEPIVFEDVHFDFDRFTLRPEATKILDQAVGVLQKNPQVQVTIEGHTDSVGTTEYNLALGERRATSVQEYLVSRGIAANRIQIISFGEERPVADNQTADGRARNRRAVTVVRMN